MEEASAHDLRVELEQLQAREALLSADHSRLHDQIDFGFASGTTREREREISDERQQLQHRIDELRALLGITP